MDVIVEPGEWVTRVNGNAVFSGTLPDALDRAQAEEIALPESTRITVSHSDANSRVAVGRVGDNMGRA